MCAYIEEGLAIKSSDYRGRRCHTRVYLLPTLGFNAARALTREEVVCRPYFFFLSSLFSVRREDVISRTD